MIELASGEHRVCIDPDLGGRITSWQIADVEVLAESGEHPIHGGLYLMAPWVGRLAGGRVRFEGRDYPQPANFEHWAIHGSLPFSRCTVLAESECEAVLSHETPESWPVPAVVTLLWHLHDWGLSSTASVSTPTGSFPAAIGWHPWFRRQLPGFAPIRYHINSVSQFQVDDDQIVTAAPGPISSGPYDHSFVVPDGGAILEWPGFRRIAVRSDLKFMHVYEAREHLCIEPQTAPPNGVNLRTLGYGHVVSNGEPLMASCNWEVSPA